MKKTLGDNQHQILKMNIFEELVVTNIFMIIKENVFFFFSNNESALTGICHYKVRGGTFQM